MAQQRPIAELVHEIKSRYGLTWDEMAQELGRSPRMMRKLATGESSGENYRKSLTEFYEKGRVETLTPRRRTKDGKLAKIRSKKGAKTVSRTPEDTRGRRVEKRKNNRFYREPTQYLAGGAKLDHTSMPAGKNTKGREEGWKSIESSLRRATKSQSHHDRRVKYTVTVKTASGQYRQYTLGSKGGYHASDVLSDIRTVHGGSIQSWFSYQIESIYPDSEVTIVGVEQLEFNATRSKATRKAQDAAGTRRGKQWGNFH